MTERKIHLTTTIDGKIDLDMNIDKNLYQAIRRTVSNYQHAKNWG
jgi:hypothetical protein